MPRPSPDRSVQPAASADHVLRRNVVANYVAQAWSAMIGIVAVPIYVSYLGMEAYGLIGLFAVLQAWLVLLDMGMSPTLSRQMALHVARGENPTFIRDLLRSIEVIAIAVSGTVAIGVWWSSSWLATNWLQAERLPLATVVFSFKVMGIITALRFVEGIYRSCLSGLQKQVMLNVIVGIGATFRSVGAITVLAFYSSDVVTFFYWQVFASVLTIAALVLVSYVELPAIGRPARFSLTALKGVSSFALGVLGVTFLSIILTQVDKVLLASLVSLSEFGHYTLANVLASSVFMLVYPLNAAWQPRMTELIAKGDERTLAALYHLGCQLIAVGAGSVSVVLAVFPEHALYLWTGDQALAVTTAATLRALAIGNMLNSMMNLPYCLQMSYGWTGLATRTNSVAIIFLVPAIFLVTPGFGAEGAAWVWVALNLGYFLATPTLVHRRLLAGEKRSWYTHDTFQPLAFAVTTAMVLRLALPAMPSRGALVVFLPLAGLCVLASAILGAVQVRARALAIATAALRQRWI